MKKGLIGIGMAAVILCTGTMSVFAHGHGHAHMCYQWAQQINTNAVANANAANPTKTVMSNTSGVKQMTVNTAVKKNIVTVPDTSAVQQTVSNTNTAVKQQVVSYSCATPGCGYTDANGDGICDNCGVNLHCGRGWVLGSAAKETEAYPIYSKSTKKPG